MNNTENNKIIADFMEYKTEIRLGIKRYLIGNYWIHPDNLKFHNDWNLLMSVVDKLEKIKGVHIIISSGLLCIFRFGKLIIRQNSDTKIHSVYDTVLIAINNIL